MACLKNRGGIWFARIRWTDEYKVRQEKQVTLRTKSKVTARHRLSFVNKEEKDIINGMSFSFPWMNDEGQTKLVRFTLNDAINEWISRRKKLNIRTKTLETNENGLTHFEKYIGGSFPLRAIQTTHIDDFIDHLRDIGLSITSINIHLRTIKTMFRYYLKRERLDKIPLIEQLANENEEIPIYITDTEFQAIMDLDWLDPFYKKVFYFYRETGCRLREPFFSILDRNWLDIPNLSKGKKPRSIELINSLVQIYKELIDWYGKCGLVEESKGRHISKMFKKALRFIGANETKHFHSLRHTYAVRKIVNNVSIYKIQIIMGHSSVTTTEKYLKMDPKRLQKDFPTLVQNYLKNGKGDMVLWDTKEMDTPFLVGGVVN